MFNDQELVKISEAINGTWLLVNNQALSDFALDVFLEDVDGHSFVDVMTAIRNARKQAKGRISIGDIMQQMESMDGRPSAEEAWALAVKSLDENLTIALTQETQEAWSSGASELLDIGDKFNASRAYIEKYNQLVTAARDKNVPISWFVSLGDDKDQRDNVVRQAYAEKKITKAQAQTMLPFHKTDEGTYKALQKSVALMIENKGANAGHEMLQRSEELKKAAQIHQDRIAQLRKALQTDEQPRYDGAKSKRDTLSIFEDAERLGVFTSDAERKAWCAKAANGESMKDLQMMMLAKRQEIKTAGAA